MDESKEEHKELIWWPLVRQRIYTYISQSQRLRPSKREVDEIKRARIDWNRKDSSPSI